MKKRITALLLSTVMILTSTDIGSVSAEEILPEEMSVEEETKMTEEAFEASESTELSKIQDTDIMSETIEMPETVEMSEISESSEASEEFSLSEDTTISLITSDVSESFDEGGESESITETTQLEEETEEKPEEGTETEVVSDAAVNRDEIDGEGINLPEGCIDGNVYGNIKWLLYENGELVIDGVAYGTGIGMDDYNFGAWTSYCDRVTSAKVILSGKIGDQAEGMFSRFEKLESIDLSGFDTSGVTSMAGMFSGCKSLRQIDVSGFDTSSVTDMTGMFYNCSALTELDVSGFNTENVTDMHSMFYGCSNLEKINVKNFNTSKVTTMSDMFTGCKSLTELDVNHFDTGNVTDMLRMFSECSSLTNLDISNFDTKNVTRFISMFSGCSGLLQLDISNFNTDSAEWMSNLFSDCSSLKVLDMSKVEFTHADEMLSGCTSLCFIYSPVNDGRFKGGLPVSSPEDKWYLADGSEWNESFIPWSSMSPYIYRSDYTGEQTDTTKKELFVSGVKINQNIIYNGNSVIPYDGIAFASDEEGNPVSGVSLSEGIYTGTLADGSAYTESTQAPSQAGTYQLSFAITGENADQYYLRKTTYRFQINQKEVTITAPILYVEKEEERPDLAQLPYEVDGLINGDKLIKEPSFQYSENNLADFGDRIYAIIPYDAQVGSNYCIKYINGKLIVDETVYPTDQPDDSEIVKEGKIGKNLTWTVSKAGRLTVEGVLDADIGAGTMATHPWTKESGCGNIKSAVIKASGYKSAALMFAGCVNLEVIDLRGFDTSEITTMNHMFNRCLRLKHIDFGNADTGNVTDMGFMFQNCEDLRHLDLSSFDTSNVTNMESMFNECSRLRSIDLSSFDTSNVTDMSWMFYDCHLLERLDVSHFDTGNVIDMEEMFGGSGCYTLTDLDVSHFDTGNVVDMSCMFHGCSGLTELDLSSFDTSKVKYMSQMFHGCSGLTELDLSSFDTGNVTSMMGMFEKCSGLKKIDITGFDITNTGISNLFDGCTSLISVDLSGFDMKDNDRSMSDLLRGCSQLSCIATPLNVTKDVRLPGKENDVWYYKGSSETTEFLPKNLDHSVVLCKNDYPGTEIGLSKQTVYVSGITVDKNKVYDGTPCAYSGTPAIVDEKGNPLSEVTITEGIYTGTLMDGSKYDNTTQAPTQAGNYKLVFSIPAEAQEHYRLARNSYSFCIQQKTVTIKAPTLSIDINDELPKLDEQTCEISGISEDEGFVVKPLLKYSKDNIETAKEGTYKIIPYGVEGGNNYQIKYVNGTLTVGNSGSNPSGKPEDDFSYPDSMDLASDVKGTISAVKAKIYDGEAYEPEVKVTVLENKKKKILTEGTEYYVTYEKNINAGTGTVIVKGIGNYKGKLVQTFEITPKSISKTKFVTGSMIVGDQISDASIYIYDGNKLLDKKDYTLSAEENVTEKPSKGVAVTIKGTGNYKDSKTVQLAVYESAQEQSRVITAANVTLANTQMSYTGKAIKDNEPTVKIGETILTKNKDYKVQYQNNKDAGTAFVVITGKREYKGRAVVSFQIVPENTQNVVILPIKDKTYNGKLQKPAVKVKAGKKTLKKNKDYTVRYKANLHAGTATVTVTGKGNYTISAKQTFQIKKLDIKKVSVKGTQKDGLILTYKNRVLRENVDYTLEYGKTKGNKIEVVIHAAANSDFTGSVTKSVKVNDSKKAK